MICDVRRFVPLLWRRTTRVCADFFSFSRKKKNVHRVRALSTEHIEIS